MRMKEEILVPQNPFWVLLSDRRNGREIKKKFQGFISLNFILTTY